MKLLVLTFSLLASAFGLTSGKNETPKPQKNFYNFKVKSIDGQTIDFSKIQRQESVGGKCGFQVRLHALICRLAEAA